MGSGLLSALYIVGLSVNPHTAVVRVVQVLPTGACCVNGEGLCMVGCYKKGLYRLVYVGFMLYL